MSISIFPVVRKQGICGTPKIPGDKSISHRSLMFGAIASGTTEISNLLPSEDVFSTWKCLEAMGISISPKNRKVYVQGRGKKGLSAPHLPLDCGNSGTTIRLLMGILSGQPFSCTLTGDQSLRKRPMKRVAVPLREMGAEITLDQGQLAPVLLKGTPALKPIHYQLNVASAQLKSAVILAGIFASGESKVSGLIKSRDHTERMLPHFGLPIKVDDQSISIIGRRPLYANSVKVPGDPSSAAFWIAAATLVKGSKVQIENCSLNPTRTGFMNALIRMGAKIDTELTSEKPEPVGTLLVSHQELQGISICADDIPALIDELPLLAVLATQAKGTTLIRGAEELRVKETDRIEAVAKNLRAMGAKIDVFDDGFAIEGPQKLRGACIDSMDDHRIAMSFSIAGLVADGTTEIMDAECVRISYPNFFETLHDLAYQS